MLAISAHRPRAGACGCEMIAWKRTFARCGEVVRLLTSPSETDQQSSLARIAGLGAVKRPLATASELAHSAYSTNFTGSIDYRVWEASLGGIMFAIQKKRRALLRILHIAAALLVTRASSGDSRTARRDNEDS